MGCLEDVLAESNASTKEERDQIVALFNDAKTQLDAVKNQPNVSELMDEWMKRQVKDEQIAAMTRKKTAAVQNLRLAQMLEEVNIHYKGGKELPKAVISMIEGDSLRNGISASAMQGAKHRELMHLHAQQMAAMGEDVDRVLKGGLLDAEIMDAMHKLKQDIDTSKIDPMAVQIAEHLNELGDTMRRELVDAGATINDRLDWLHKQNHDMHKIRKAKYEGWWGFVEKRIDYEKSFGATRDKVNPELVKEVSMGWWQALQSGNHIKADVSGGGRPTVGNVASKMGAQRKIIMKDGTAFHEYSKEFGLGNLRNAMDAQMRSTARTWGILKRLGPDYKKNIDALISELTKKAKSSGDDVGDAALGSTKFKADLKDAINSMDGSADIPANEMLSTVFSASRMLINMKSLGSSVFTAFTDMTTIARNMNLKGKGFLSGYGESVNQIFSTGEAAKDRRAIAQSTGVGLDVFRALIAEDFRSADTKMGKMSAAQNLYFRLNLLQPWTENMRIATSVFESTYMAEKINTQFNELPSGYRIALEGMQIGDAEWKALKHAVMEQKLDGRQVKTITPEAIYADEARGIKGVPDSSIEDILNSRGVPITETAMKETREKLDQQLRIYFQDAMNEAVIEPNARTRRKIRMGQQSGKLHSEVWFNMMQFKSHPISFINQRLARDVELSTGERAGSKEAWKQVDGWGPSMAGFIMQLTVMGYTAMALKDVAKNRTPRDPTDPKTVMAAFAQGGGLGIYGDFLFGEMKNRFGGGPIDTLVGPSAGVVNNMLDLWGRAKAGDDVGSAALKFFINNSPGANLPYFKMAIDQLFVNELMEQINPGQAKRTEARRFNETGQTPLL